MLSVYLSVTRMELHIKERLFYIALVLSTIALGLLSRADFISVPTFLATYAGDTLWAMMVYWGFRFLFPTQPIAISVISALVFSFAIETSQLYHATWIDDIRSTKLGGLILGFGFKLSDLICYSCGIAFGAFLNLYFLPRFRNVHA